MKRRYKRRLFPVVNPSLQFRFLAIILAYGGLTILVLGAALFFPDFLRLSDEMLDLQAKMRASEIIVAIHQRLWIPLILLLAIIGAHFFRIFHRVVGPLYRFRWAFGEIAKGDLSLTVRIRQNDFLHLEEEALNSMIGVLSDKVEEIRAATAEASSSLESLEKEMTSLPEAGQPEIFLRLREHHQTVEAVMAKINFFKLV
jgi:methyl-accepting chemotaxis protein